MKTIKVVKYAFAVVGVCMLIGAFFSYKNTQKFIEGALSAQGTVVQLMRTKSNSSYNYKPVVEFKTHDGSTVKFRSTSGSNPPSYSRGEIVEVLYEKSFPERARIKGLFSLWGGAIILGALGLIFFLTGYSIIFFGKLKSKKSEYLRKNGIPVKAKFQNVGLNTSLKVGGRSPYQIHSQWKNPATSELHVFSSDNIWFDPTDHILNDEITVFIEGDNPKKYYVDISFLPKVVS